MPSKPDRYRDLSVESRGAQDDTGSEASVPLMGRDDDGEKTFRANGRDRETRRNQFRSMLSSWRWLLDTALLLVIVGLLLDRRWQDPRHARFEGAGDLTGFAPRVAQQITTFSPDFSYAPDNATEFFSPEVRKKWTDLVPKGLGYVVVEHPERYDNLPVPLKGYNHTTYTTSMTHQLHCLYAIMEEYQGMLAFPGLKESDMAWHVNHCFEYLRQSIMCCGDTALEGQQTSFPDGWVGSDGWDAKHVCKDYGQIYRHLEEHRADNHSWI